MSSAFRSGLLALCIVLAGFSLLYAQDPGRITGMVRTVDGEPLGHANVVVTGTAYGAASRSDGSFSIENVPPGTYTVKAMMMGYTADVAEHVVVRAGRSTDIEFALEKTVVMTVPVIDVIGQRDEDDIDRTGTVRDVPIDGVEVGTANTLDDFLTRVPGVVFQGEEFHVRGGRAGEMKSYVDGMPITETLVANTELTLSTVSLADVEILTGGFDAEYGNVQSGVVNIRTREGGTTSSGVVTFMTDDFGAPDKTYFNYDNLAIGVG